MTETNVISIDPEKKIKLKETFTALLAPFLADLKPDNIEIEALSLNASDDLLNQGITLLAGGAERFLSRTEEVKVTFNHEAMTSEIAQTLAETLAELTTVHCSHSDNSITLHGEFDRLFHGVSSQDFVEKTFLKKASPSVLALRN